MIALDAAEQASKEGIDVEVIDLRTLAPLDKDAIFASLEKTSRALVVHEDVKTLGLGAEGLRFPSPLRPDDEITLSSECVASRSSASRPDLGIVTTRTQLVNQREELVMAMDSTFMVRKRPA